MADLSLHAKMSYIGLWCLADDAGFLDWDARAIAAAVYTYEAPRQRERRVTADLQELIAAERVEVQPCKRHAVIPTLSRHRVQGGAKVFTIQLDHQKDCYTSPRSIPSDSVPVSGSVNGSVNGSVRARRAPEDWSKDQGDTSERAYGVLEDQTSSEELKRIARDHLTHLGLPLSRTEAA